jgi:acyl-CoA oxidase
MGMTEHLYFSAVGVKDGRAYETLWERAQLEPLNETEIPSGYEVSTRH